MSINYWNKTIGPSCKNFYKLYFYVICNSYNWCPLPSSRYHLSYNDCLEDKRENYQNCSLFFGWLDSLMAKALDLQLAGCKCNSWPWRCRVTTLGKLFTPTCLSRLQWFSDGMIDCGVRGHGQLCLSRQPLWCTVLGMGCAPFLQCLGRLSLPPPWDDKMSISFRAE